MSKSQNSPPRKSIGEDGEYNINQISTPNLTLEPTTATTTATREHHTKAQIPPHTHTYNHPETIPKSITKEEVAVSKGGTRYSSHRAGRNGSAGGGARGAGG